MATTTTGTGAPANGPTLSTHTQAQAPALLRISPQTFQFTASKVSSGLVSKLKIKNLMEASVGYKFKTNAPLRYSVKPVLGVLEPGQSIEVFVRCESWVNPQDRFLLQSVALGKEESQQIDAVTWKEIDRRRILEHFIQCSSSSTLAMRDPLDDGGSISSSSNTSSTRSSASSSNNHSHSSQSELARQQQRAYLQRNGQNPMVVAHVHAASRKMSTGSSTSSAASSPGSYPTLFSSKNATTSTSSPERLTSHTMASSKEKSATESLRTGPVGYMTTKLSNSKQTIRTVSRFLAVRQYTKIQVLTVSVICLLLGLLLPLEKIFLLAGRESLVGASTTSSSAGSSASFMNSAMGHQKAPIFSASSSSSSAPILVTSLTPKIVVSSTHVPRLTDMILDHIASQETPQTATEQLDPVIVTGEGSL
ncbi:Motile sperm domain-containing protein 2 [Mortierella claussenii]|nr:Motile sperm domain-containing protein 2 [Mortierella claussenii]